MLARRIKEALAILIVGHGVVDLVAPSRHARLWQGGPRGYRQAMQAFIDHPNMTRLTALGQIVSGLWLASRQWPRP